MTTTRMGTKATKVKPAKKKRAASEKLDGYRELGERLAKMAEERDYWRHVAEREEPPRDDPAWG